MAKKEKTLTQKYPILGFRVTEDVYDGLTGQIEAVLNRYNKKSLAAGKKKYKKNEIFVKALKRGLSQIKFELDQK